MLGILNAVNILASLLILEDEMKYVGSNLIINLYCTHSVCDSVHGCETQSKYSGTFENVLQQSSNIFKSNI